MIYDTMIKLSLVEHGVLSGISAIVAQLARGTGEAKKFEAALGNLKTAAWGAAGIFAGWEAIKGIKHLADDAKELSHELVQIKKLNSEISGKEFKQITEWAYGLPARVPGTTTVEGLKTYGAIQSMFGKDQALSMGDSIARFGQVLGNQKGDWSGTSEQVLKMIRSGDLLGKFVDATTHKVDVVRLQKFLDLGTKVINATHGMVNPATWFQMAQQGGPALSSMTDEGLMSMAMAAQGMGGFRSGTAMTSLYQQMIGGKMTKYAAQELSGMGLVGKNYEVTEGGHIVWGKGALDTEFTRAIQKDPLKATDIMREAMEKSGFTSIETQIPELFKMLGRQTTQRLLHDFLRNMPQMLGERGRLEGGMGAFGSADIANQEDYTQVMHNAAAAWNDMTAKIGLPITIAAIPVMKKITDIFLKLGIVATQHPEAIARIAEGIAALGVALIGGGGVAILAALGPAGWLATGIIAVGIAMANYKNPIMAWLESIKNTNWNEEITKALAPAVIAIKAWFSTLGTSIIDALKGMWADMKGALGNLFHASYGGAGIGGGGGGITNAAWSGGGGGVIPGGGGGGDMMGAVAGSAALRQYLATGGHGMNPQTTAWCAAYVGAYLNHHGYQSLSSNVATSYLNYGFRSYRWNPER